MPNKLLSVNQWGSDEWKENKKYTKVHPVQGLRAIQGRFEMVMMIAVYDMNERSVKKLILWDKEDR